MAVDAQLSESEYSDSDISLRGVGVEATDQCEEQALETVFDDIDPLTDKVAYSVALDSVPDETIVQMIRDLIDRRSYGRSIYQTRSLTPRRRR